MTRIEFFRRTAGLSQTELARRIGIHPTNLTLLERGHRRAWPKIRQQLSKALGVPEDELFGPDGWPLKAELGNKKTAG